MKGCYPIVILSLLGACHREVGVPPEPLEVCYSAYPPPSDGRIRIDGPGSFGPHANDTLIVRVDARDRWRGAIQTCNDGVPGSLRVDFRPWQAAGDTLALEAFDRLPPYDGRRATWLMQLVSRRKTKS